MRLKNKKTGAIGNLQPYGNDGRIWVWIENTSKAEYRYESLAELNEDWEDYKELKKHYEILAMGAVMEREDAEDEIFRNQGQREIGNYFSSREEAEKAVEKLKAWKRLRDKGFRFTGLSNESIGYEIKELSGDFALDLDLLFNGGEE